MSKEKEIVEEFKRKVPLTTNQNWKSKNPDQYAAAIQLYLDGYPLRKIGEYFGVCYEALRKNFSQDGVPMRKPGQRKKHF